MIDWGQVGLLLLGWFFGLGAGVMLEAWANMRVGKNVKVQCRKVVDFPEGFSSDVVAFAKELLKA